MTSTENAQKDVPAHAEGVKKKAGGRPFKSGAEWTGNAKGRPRGKRNPATILIENMVETEAEALTRQLITQAMNGDSKCLLACIDRLAPPRKDRTLDFSLPAVNTLADLPLATESLINAVASGVLTPLEARSVGDLLDRHHSAMTAAALHNASSSPEVAAALSHVLGGLLPALSGHPEAARLVADALARTEASADPDTDDTE